MRALVLTVVTALLLSACSLPKIGLPRVHKVPVQQGNVLTQDMIDKLKPGMTRTQVVFVMGEPVFRNAFDDDRWDYIYTLQIPGYYEEQKRMSLYFENGVLAYFTGDYAPTAATGGEGEAAADPGATASTEAEVDARTL